MNARRKGPRVEAAESEDRLLREILGYLNFSGGKPDAAFQRNWNALYIRPEYLESDTALPEYLGRELVRLQPDVPALADSSQAAAVLSLVFGVSATAKAVQVTVALSGSWSVSA